MERTIGVILSGGQSRRMGRDKAGLSLAGQSFLDRMTKELSPLFDGIYVSVDRPGRPSHAFVCPAASAGR